MQHPQTERNSSLWIAIAGLWLFPSLAFAECDCTIYPYTPDPPCYQQCSANLIAKSDFKTLTDVLGMRREAAEKITAIPRAEKPHDFSAYASILPEKDFQALKTRLYTLSPKDLERLKAQTLRYDRLQLE